MPKTRVTLRSLAQQLGLHVSTISRVLNGSDEEACKAASIERVREIRALARELGYQANPQAKTLRTKRSRELAVLVPRLSDIVMATMYEGIDEAAERHGYTTYVSNTLDDPERQRALGERALNRNVEGLIIADAHCTPEPSWLEELAARGVNFLLVIRRRGQHLSISCDDMEGGRLAAAHLWQQGHRRVAVLGGEAHSSSGKDRTRGFIRFYQEQGCPVAEGNILHGLFDTATGRQQGAQLLAQGQRPTAIFCVNDFLAIGLYGAMRQYDLVPGRDIAVVGYNDTPLAAQLSIPLTSINSFARQQGAASVEVFMQLLDGQFPQSTLIRPQLNVRESSQFQCAH